MIRALPSKSPYRECFYMIECFYASLLSGAGQPINSTKKVVP